MKLSTLALAAGAFILTFIGVSWYLGSLPQLTEKALSLFGPIKTFFQPLINAWNGLPSVVRNIIMLGIPFLVTLFFAWTKNLAVKKMQQTEAEASMQANQLYGELSETQRAALKISKENTTLKDQLAVYEKGDNAVATLNQKISSLQSTVNSQATQLSNVTIERNYLQKEVDDWKTRITSDPRLKQLLGLE